MSGRNLEIQNLAIAVFRLCSAKIEILVCWHDKVHRNGVRIVRDLQTSDI